MNTPLKSRFSLKSLALAGLALGAFSSISPAFAADNSSQDVNFEVTAINEITVAGTPSLTINSATVAGPTSVSDTASTYAISTNEVNKKIVAKIDADMPSGVTLTTTLAAPATASSSGAKALSAADTDVVTDISALSAAGLGITYNLSATSAAGVVPADTRTVTYTIVDG